MPSKYSRSLRLELIAAGDQAGTWGTTTNNNLGNLLEQSIAGLSSIALSDADYLLTAFNGAVDDSRSAMLAFAGALTAQRNIGIPPLSKIYSVTNNTTGGFGLFVTVIGSQGTVVPAGKTMWLLCDGINVVEGLNNIAGNFNVVGNLTIGGTTALKALTLTGLLNGTTANLSGLLSAGTLSTTGTLSAGATTVSSLTSQGGVTAAGALNALSASLATPLPITSGGTGVTSSAAALAAFGGVSATSPTISNPTFTGVPVTPDPAAQNLSQQVANTEWIGANYLKRYIAETIIHPLTVTPGEANSNALTLTGTGTGAGVVAVGGNTSGSGGILQGHGTGYGLQATAGPTGGYGVVGTNGAVSGYGVFGQMGGPVGTAGGGVLGYNNAGNIFGILGYQDGAGNNYSYYGNGLSFSPFIRSGGNTAATGFELLDGSDIVALFSPLLTANPVNPGYIKFPASGINWYFCFGSTTSNGSGLAVLGVPISMSGIWLAGATVAVANTPYQPTAFNIYNNSANTITFYSNAANQPVYMWALVT